MAFRDYSTLPASNETAGDSVFVGPNMPRDNVRPAIQQLMADGKELYNELVTRTSGNDPETVSVRDYGAVGDGVTDDTAAIDLAMATGKRVVFPKGYTFKTSTILGHRFAVDRQVVQLDGDLVHSGALPTIVGPYRGFFGLFSAVEVEGIQLVGGGKLSGAWDGDTTLDIGRIGTGLFLSNCPNAVVDGPLFTLFYDDGIKANNCADLVVTASTRFFHIWNVGVEISSYAANPFTVFGSAGGFLAEAWVNDPAGPSGYIDGTYEWINDGKMGAGNGTAIDFSTEPGAPACNNLRIRGSITDCLLGIWSENNGTDAYNVDIDVVIRGNVRGVGAVDPKERAHCSDGIGLIGVTGGRVRAQIVDQTNIAPPGGAETAGLNIIQCSNIDADVKITTDTGIANRMQHAIKLSESTNIKLRGQQSGVTGISTLAPTYSTPILFDTVDAAGAACTDVDIAEFVGGEPAQDWTTAYGSGNNHGGGKSGVSLPSGLIPLRFTYANVPTSSTNLKLLTLGNGFDSEVLPTSGRLVGMTARTSAAPTGSVSLVAYAAGVAQSSLSLAAGDFASQAASKMIDGKAALQAAAKSSVEVKITTSGTWVNTVDVEVTLWFDPRWKA